MEGNEDVNFLELSAKKIGNISLEKTQILNERQCRNLLCHFQKCLKVLQEIVSPYINGFGPIWKDFFQIASKAGMVLDSCTKDDWHQEALLQNANKETFRELLLDLEDFVNIICENLQNQHLITLQKMIELKCCTSFLPAEIDEVEKDQILLGERLVSDVKTLPIDSNNFKLAKYLLEMMECSRKVEGGELDNIQFPLNLPCPKFGDPPKSLGRAGLIGVHVYGTEWLGVRTATKTIDLDVVNTKDQLEKEASILAGLNHPNIIKFFYCGMKDTTNDLLFGMEKGEKNLSKLLFEEGKNVTYKAKFNIMLQLASGMCYLHDMKVAHRDLKPENVIVSSMHVPELDGDGYVIAKLVDFGISKIEVKSNPELPTGGTTFGTYGYIAPEAINKKLHDTILEVDAFKADVFSFGVMCYVILTQSISPFQELRKREELLKELNSRKNQLMPNDIMPELCLLIEECWSSNPSKRPLFSNIHQRLKDIHKKSFKASIRCEASKSFDIDSSKNARGWRANLLSIFMHLKEWLKNFYAIFIFFIFHNGWWKYVNMPRLKASSVLVNIHVQENKLSKTYENAIGVQDKLIEVKNLLQRNAMLGICGMGGVGKTTLVKALKTRMEKDLRDNASTHKVRGLKVDISVQRHVSISDLESTTFEDIIFISDMKDMVKNEVDHLEVMRRILKSMNVPYEVHHLEEGRSYLLKTLKDKRVLLIIDDVGGMNKLDKLLTTEMFSVGGSKLIATSRDWNKLKCIINDSCKMILRTLDEPQAMKLFSKHAFKNAQGICPPYLKQISTKIVKSCDGLPLSLEVLGSQLCGEERIRVWERALQRLLKANALVGSDDDKLWSRLRLSFDDLNLEEEKIVMDICFFFVKMFL